MLTGVGSDTALVLIVKFALIAPAGTVTVGGTASGTVVLVNPRPSFTDIATTAPPGGAGLVRCSTPSGDCPPVTVVGYICTMVTLGNVGETPVVNVLVVDQSLKLPARSAVRTRQYHGT